VETYSQETTVYSNNPVNVLLDYLRNPRYGKGLENESINWLSWYRSALQCGQTVTYADSSTSKAFTCDAVIDTAQSLMNNCKIIIAGMRGIMPYQQGMYSLLIENGGEDSDITITPSEVSTKYTVTNDEIIGGITLQGESKETKCNRCVVTYVDPLADYQPNEVAFPDEGSADDIAFLAEDDNYRLEKQVALPTIANRKIAEQYARVFVKRSRNQKFISFTTNLALSNAGVGDLTRVIDGFIGLDGIFRISEMTVDMNGLIGISATEHQSSAYAIGASGSDYTRPTLSLPDPTVVPAVTALTLSSGSAFDQVNNSDSYISNDGVTKRIFATWSDSSPFKTEYLVQYRESADSDFTTVTTTKVNEIFIPNVTTGTSYDVRVAAINELGRRSDFTTVSNHVVA
jgi:predicted phage tail protein